MCGTNEKTLLEARSALLQAVPGAKATVSAFDVGDEAACVAAVAGVVRATGRCPDILVNNAGINHRAPLTEVSSAAQPSYWQAQPRLWA